MGAILLDILILDERAFVGRVFLVANIGVRKKKESKKLEDLPCHRGVVFDGESLSSVEGEGVLDEPGVEQE